MSKKNGKEEMTVKTKHNAGFSLIETLIAIALLSALVIPTCSGMIMSFRINQRTDELMKAQLAVSSAVETLMAEGIKEASDDYGTVKGPDKDENGNDITVVKSDRFPDVVVKTTAAEDGGKYYTVVVTSNDGLVEVTTTIRKGG